MTRFSAPIAEQIWDMKYRFKDADGTPKDLTVEDTWHRIADALAEVENDPAAWAPKFYHALEDFKYLPAGRITSGAGTARQVTLFNCFVMGTVPDSMGGIFDRLKEAALTMQQGGGIGYDFSTIRPKGAAVKGVAADASGPLSFMDVWDAMCRTIMSAGSRRGAMMATMRDSHPDIMDFITAKNDPARLRMFNMSVLISDAFMDAVKSDSDWYLSHEVAPPPSADEVSGSFLAEDGSDRHIYSKVKARELWDAIMENTYAQAEPGVIFIDRINKANNLRYCETIAATNPCGEQPLPPYGACLLGSINMARLVTDPFTDEARLDSLVMADLVATAVRMMDNVVDTSLFPLPQQRAEAKAKRRIGLGVTGLADALLMVGLRYGSPEAASQTDEWMHLIARAAYLTSVELAKEKGAFPLFDAEKYLASGAMQSMDEDVREAIREHGIRNALLTSIAPTGTISLYAGNVSSGIEPVFAYAYTRKVLQKDGSRTEEEVVDYAVQLWRDLYGDKPLPDHFVNAQTLAPMDHVRMQAAAQKWVDSSISKTINCPEDISFEDFKEVYMAAWDQGCKGCTTYRPNEITGSVLSVAPEPTPCGMLETHPDEPDEPDVYEDFAKAVAGPIKPLLHSAMTAPYGDSPLAKRPEVLEASSYSVKLGDEPTFYVIISDITEDGETRPYEVFVNTKNPAHIAWTTALTVMVSAIFRRPYDSSFVAEDLKGVFDPKGGGWWRGKYQNSAVAAIGQVIEDHMRKLGYGSFAPQEGWMAREGRLAQYGDLEDDGSTQVSRPTGPSCPSCHGHSFRMVEGCSTCNDCGHSKCG